MQVLLRISRWLEIIGRVIAGVALLAMLGVTVVDVALRYLYRLSDGALSLSVVGSVELVSYLMLFAILAAMAANVEKAQVVVEAFSHGLSDTLKARIAGVYLLGFVVLGAILCWGLWDSGASAADYGETTQDLRLPMAPIYFFAAGLCALLSVRCLLHAVLGAVFAHRVEAVE
ncbi:MULTISPECIES: TRAP transporter small permease subunit [Modicisalibacter]|uniref:TRAP transporter small permease n=1 Tax=Modicisalibacter TaxID=574347 RepID=UPI00100AE6A5|nr:MULTISPECIES: TRAP transporter small permease subunit [Halomonadaceae]MBZ9557779.1 TRAP transporter small permease [Modicisalibacter sp. R2A 31.J]MBZ9573556.1 TRAP transporter small permease [Modicisalibacter sp. MOD 31.J]